MSSSLIRTLEEIVSLLSLCDLTDEANWFESRLVKLRKVDSTPSERRDVLAEIRSIVAGMGSFTDLPLNPPRGSKLSRAELRSRKWDLAERLDKAIAIELKPVTGR